MLIFIIFFCLQRAEQQWNLLDHWGQVWCVWGAGKFDQTQTWEQQNQVHLQWCFLGSGWPEGSELEYEQHHIYQRQCPGEHGHSAAIVSVAEECKRDNSSFLCKIL